MKTSSATKSRLETMLVILLLIMFCIATYSIVLATTVSYKKGTDENDVRDNLRLASSYIDSKLHQSDGKDIRKVDNFMGEKSAILIEEKIEDDTFQTYIFFTQGKLKELFMLKGADIDINSGFDIADLKDYIVESPKKDLLKITFKAGDDKKIYTQDSYIYLK